MLVEVLARTLKNMIRDYARARAVLAGAPSEEVFAETLVWTLNTLTGAEEGGEEWLVEEVRAFIDDKQLPFPVLLGNTSTFSDWQVKGYPTYYLVNEAGNIQARNAGYSTQIGLWLRSAL